MQLFTITALAALAAVSSAQSLNNLPPCAQQCVGNGIGSTGCNIIDIACICKSTGWIDGLSCCIATKCSADDQSTTIKFANQICQVSVTALSHESPNTNNVDEAEVFRTDCGGTSRAGVSLPSQATCASGASSTAAPTSTGAAAGTASTMVSGSVMSSPSGSVMSSASGSVMSSASGSTGTTAAPASGTASTTASAVAISTAGAAHLIGQGMGAAGAAVAALAFL